MFLLSCDPSINHLGWVVFELVSPPEESQWKLRWWGTLKTDKYKGRPIYERIILVLEELTGVLAGVLPAPFRCAYFVVEEPQLWGAFKSMASQHSTSLLTLYMLTGALCYWASTRCDKVESITVSKWKGQLPKRITKQRMEQYWKTTFKTDDESDAVGLGTYFLKREGFIE